MDGKDSNMFSVAVNGKYVCGKHSLEITKLHKETGSLKLSYF